MTLFSTGLKKAVLVYSVSSSQGQTYLIQMSIIMIIKGQRQLSVISLLFSSIPLLPPLLSYLLALLLLSSPPLDVEINRLRVGVRLSTDLLLSLSDNSFTTCRKTRVWKEQMTAAPERQENIHFLKHVDSRVLFRAKSAIQLPQREKRRALSFMIHVCITSEQLSIKMIICCRDDRLDDGMRIIMNKSFCYSKLLSPGYTDVHRASSDIMMNNM